MPREKNGDLWAITIRSTGKADCAGEIIQENTSCGHLQPSMVSYFEVTHAGSFPRNPLSHQLVDYKMNARECTINIYVRENSLLFSNIF